MGPWRRRAAGFGMIQLTGEVVIRMLADVKQKTIGPLIGR